MGHVFYKKHKDDGKKKKTDVMNFKFSMSEEETLKLKQDAEKSDSKTAEQPLNESEDKVDNEVNESGEK